VWARNEYFAKAVGHHGAILRALFNQIYVPVKVDPKTGDMYRSTVDNFARRAKYEDGGEILVKLARKESWPGYWRSKEASEKKFAFSVFEAGDVYYRPGDDLRRNSDGFWYFMDRLGDTYRWKSENVSTAEVGDVLGHFPGVLEANVYGVEVPRHEGRAGCAAVAIGAGGSDGLDWTALAKYAHSRLPRYAVPVFIRVMGGKVGETATHNNKQNKVPYRQEGVDPKLRGSKVPGGGGDVVYWLPNRASGYVPFTDQDWNGIVEGKAML
jgi:acyl-CoA synthetase (AMP-forming)/AMP-acid ligase II